MPCISIRDLIGCKFKVHGRNKEEGFDCYGLVIEIMKRQGITIPDPIYTDIQKTEETYNQLMKKIKYEKLVKPVEYCIVLIDLKNARHIGVYLGNGDFIHATENCGVIIEPIKRWNSKIEGFYKVKN